MTTINAIDLFLSDLAPKTLSENWDNDGLMLCGTGENEVSRAIICLDLNDSIIDKAIAQNAQLIITHHPYIFKPLKSISGTYYNQISKLISNGISVLSYHTRLDSAAGGVNDALAQALGLEDIKPYGVPSFEIYMGRIGSLKKALSPREFAKFVSDTLCDGQGVRYAANDENKQIVRVAVLGGAGKDFLPGAIAAGADAFVSSDLSHNAFIDGANAGITVVDAGHYYTENPVCTKLCMLLADKFPSTEFSVVNSGSPYQTI